MAAARAADLLPHQPPLAGVMVAPRTKRPSAVAVANKAGLRIGYSVGRMARTLNCEAELACTQPPRARGWRRSLGSPRDSGRRGRSAPNASDPREAQIHRGFRGLSASP